MPKYQKPPLPVPNRRDSLWRGCLHAYAAGWEKGFRDVSLETAAVSDVKKTVGTWSAQPDDGNYSTGIGGRLVSSSTLAGIIKRLTWPNTSGRFNVAAGFSCAVLVRLNVLPLVGSAMSAYSQAVDGNNFSFVVDIFNPGVPIWVVVGMTVPPVQVGIGSTTAPLVGRTDLIVGVHDLATLKIYVNGNQEGSIAYATPIQTLPATPIGLSQLDFAGPGNGLDADYGMCAFWNRPLANSEINRLTADPYRMWRNQG